MQSQKGPTSSALASKQNTTAQNQKRRPMSTRRGEWFSLKFSPTQGPCVHRKDIRRSPGRFCLQSATAPSTAIFVSRVSLSSQPIDPLLFQQSREDFSLSSLLLLCNHILKNHPTPSSPLRSIGTEGGVGAPCKVTPSPWSARNFSLAFIPACPYLVHVQAMPFSPASISKKQNGSKESQHLRVRLTYLLR